MMDYRRHNAALLIMLTMCACTHERSESVHQSQPASAFRQLPSDLRITLVRDGFACCEGSFPSYTVEILADGSVSFQGRQFAKPKDSACIDSPGLRGLFDMIDSIGFFNFPDSLHCPLIATDHPSAITTVTMNDRIKSVYHYLGASCSRIDTAITELENTIDAMTQTIKWIELPL